MISLHADDFGYDEAVDEQMLKLLRGKKIAGISVLSTMVSKVSLKKLAHTVHGRRSPRVSLHVNLTETTKNREFVGAGFSRPQVLNRSAPYRARKPRPYNNAASGLIPFVFKLLTRRISQKSVEKEIERQLHILTKAGIKVTAIDSHQHVHALSPVAEAVVSVARKHKIKYFRSYRAVECYTVIAQIKYRILQIVGFLSHCVYHGRFGLPMTWKISGDSIAVMSWESQVKGQRLITNDHITYITHPYLPFDSNTHYMKFIQNQPSLKLWRAKGGEHT